MSQHNIPALPFRHPEGVETLEHHHTIKIVGPGVTLVVVVNEANDLAIVDSVMEKIRAWVAAQKETGPEVVTTEEQLTS